MTRLWADWSGVQIPAGPRVFPLLQSVQTNSGNCQVSYSKVTSSSFLRVQWPWHQADHTSSATKVKR